MKIFAIRVIAIVMALVFLIGAIYTFCLAGYMSILSAEVSEAALRAKSGDYHDKQTYEIIYRDVQEVRNEIYYGGGYKSWFSTSPKIVQCLVLLAYVAIIIFEAYAVYVIVKIRNERKERKMRRMKSLVRSK